MISNKRIMVDDQAESTTERIAPVAATIVMITHSINRIISPMLSLGLSLK